VALPEAVITAVANPVEGGTVTGGRTYFVDDPVVVEAIPNEDYNFVNWTENDEEVSTNAVYTFYAEVDRNLVANFIRKPCLISVSANPPAGGEVTGGSLYPHNSNVSLTATPNTGYQFVNWTEDGTAVSTNATYSFTATVSRTLVANFALKSYTISVSANNPTYGSVSGGGTFMHFELVTVTATANASYNFVSWKEADTVVSTAAEFSFSADGNRTLVAHFSGNTHTVTFDPQGGSAVDPQNVEHGGKATKPTDPTRADYIFGGWYKDAACTNIWSFDNDEVTSDITLYADWIPASATTYKVTFNSQGGSHVEQQIIAAGEKASHPTAPTRDGYTFSGWHREAGCVNAWDFAVDLVTQDTTLYAKWTEVGANTYVVTFNSQGGSAVDPQTVAHDGKVIEPTPPTRAAGYTFGGWYRESACTNIWNFATDVVTANITLYAKWTGGPTAVSAEAQTAVKLYPNPVVNGQLIIDNEQWKAGETVKVYSINGALVATYTTTGEKTSVSVSQLPNGTYLLRVGKYTAKFVKQ
jgi:uncharacterized repeat protein (TIGR02543 family)